MSSNNQTVLIVLAGVAAGLAIWMIVKQDRKRREGFIGNGGPRLKDFEMPYLIASDMGAGRYWRSRANYMDVTKSPNYLMDPHDETLPLEMASVAPGLDLLPLYTPNLTGGQYSKGPNGYVATLPDDLATRMGNTMNSNQVFTSWLNSAREDGIVGDYPTAFSISQSML